MSDLSSRQVRWFALLLTLVLIPVTYLLSASGKVQVNAEALKLFAPLPAVMSSPDNPVSDAKVTLGRILYYDPRLSASQKISCNTCHPLDAYGAESKPVSTGHKNQKGTRNAPTVYNAAGHFVQFWDGRAPSVEEQAKGPILNPVEMAMPSDRALLLELAAMPAYRDAFHRAFPGEANPVTYDNVGRAIGAFERELVTPGRWDALLKGDSTALTPAEKQGFNDFVEVGCVSCHNGPYIGGQMYQKAGLVAPWPDRSDPGRIAVTHQAADSMVFKVPSLRNIAMTGPYFHNGGTASLAEAVRMMGRYQLGRDLTDAQVASIVTYLKALTGEIPAAYIAAPQSPRDR